MSADTLVCWDTLKEAHPNTVVAMLPTTPSGVHEQMMPEVYDTCTVVYLVCVFRGVIYARAEIEVPRGILVVVSRQLNVKVLDAQ